MFDCVDRDTCDGHRFDDVDVDRSEVCRIAPIRRCPLRGEHADLFALVDHAECCVGNVAIGIETDGDCEVRRARSVVSVEEIAVVEIDVRARCFRYRNRGLVDGEVVVAAQHRKRP